MKLILICFTFLCTGLFAQELSLKVIDTDFSKGRLVNEQIITLTDVSKLHGHMCDGLVLGFLASQQALYQLFPDSTIDRTNIRITSKSSPCISDIGIYLTGGRYQYNSFYVNDSMTYLYIIQRVDNKKTIGVTVVPDLIPTKIKELGALAIKNQLNECQLLELRTLEDNFIQLLLKSNPKDLFTLTELNDFIWESPLKKTYLKTDILNKNKSKCE